MYNVYISFYKDKEFLGELIYPEMEDDKIRRACEVLGALGRIFPKANYHYTIRRGM